MGVGGEGLVGPVVGRRVGDVVRIEADVDRLALQPLALQPGLDHVELGDAVAIAAVDPGDRPAPRVGARVGGDHVVEAEPAGDRGGVEPVGGGRQHQPPPGRLVLGDPGARAGQDVGRDLRRGEALHHRLEPLGRGGADQQPVIPFLEPRPVDQPAGA